MITTDRHITVFGMSIGISKSLKDLYDDDELNVQNLNAIAYCGAVDNWRSKRYNQLNNNDNRTDGNNPEIFPIVNGMPENPDAVLYKVDTSVKESYKYYKRNILLYSDNIWSLRKDYYDGTETDVYIITDIEIQKLIYLPQIRSGSITPSSQSGDYNGTYYYPYVGNFTNTYDTSTDMTISMATFIIDNADIFIFNADFFNCPRASSNSPIAQNITSNNRNLSVSVNNAIKALTDDTLIFFAVPNISHVGELTEGTYGSGFSYAWSSSDEKSICYGNYNLYSTDALFTLVDMSDVMTNISQIGIKFAYENVMYKPIIRGGLVVGYTDDMETESEFDTWNNISNHNIPIEPPPDAVDDEDHIEDMELGYTGYNTGFVKYYQTTIGNLDAISTALSSQTQYTNLAENIISLKAYCVNTSNFVMSTIPENVKIGKLDTGVNCPKISTYKTTLELGSYSISGKYGNSSKPHFLDKSPYTKIEIYIPFCGTVELNDFVMYKTIDISLLVDILTGSAMGVVKCNGNIIAQKAGICGIDVPITSTDNALKMNSLITGGLNSIGSATGVITGMATKNYANVAKSVYAGINNINNMRVAENSNYTNIVGNTGDRIGNSLPSTCYIKLYRPIIDSESNYAQRQGKPCNKMLSLTNCNGFTMCSNPQVNGNMTTKEKQLIKSLLTDGVVL